jgi:hypothetical protein
MAALYQGQPFDADAIIREHFAKNPQPELGRDGKTEWRTAARTLQAFKAYRENYPREDFEPVAVEEKFELVLGEFEATMRDADGDEIVVTVTVHARGIFDLVAKWHDALWVIDHKTMTEWSDSVVDEGKASFQFMLYTWVLRQQRRDTAVAGTIGNYIVARPPYAEGRKPTPRDLPRDQFERHPYAYTEAQLAEWHARAMRLARRLWEAWRTEEWDQHSTACAHWGRCEYYQLCWECEPEWRAAAAMGADFRLRTPSPFEESE